MSTEPQETTNEENDAMKQFHADLRYWNGAQARFLAAWKQGVNLVGCDYFGDGTIEGWEAATDKNQLRPHMELIRETIGVLSSGQRVFLAAMCSFFNSGWGGDLLRATGWNGMSDYSNLDREHRQVLADLLMNYTGW